MVFAAKAGLISRQAFEKNCVAYIVKPVLKSTLMETLKELNLIP